MAATQTQLNFYNTINLEGTDLLESKIKAKDQTFRILQIMKEKGVSMTPFEVLEIYSLRFAEAPITSVRRAITDLTNCNMLEKTQEMKTEKYGKPNYKWRAK